MRDYGAFPLRKEQALLSLAKNAEELEDISSRAHVEGKISHFVRLHEGRMKVRRLFKHSAVS